MAGRRVRSHLDASQLSDRGAKIAGVARRRIGEHLREYRCAAFYPVTTVCRRVASGGYEMPTYHALRKEWIVKFMILSYGSQQDYDEMAGKPGDRPTWSRDDFVAMATFMRELNSELQESGELVETRGLSAPVHTRRIKMREGVPVVTDGPYAESQEVLAGYWVVDCESFDRATEIAARLSSGPVPEHVRARAYADVRPIDEHLPYSGA